MLEKFTAMQDRVLERCLKSSLPYRIEPGMLEKLTAMLEKLTAILEKLTAMQDRLFQRCLKSSQPCRIDSARDA